jgi:hypothetical protein
MTKQIAYRFFSPKSAPYYVSELKGQGGVDWGYTDKIVFRKGYEGMRYNRISISSKLVI